MFAGGRPRRRFGYRGFVDAEPPILVSACLAGLATTHAGVAKPNAEVMELVRQGRAILVCPEQLGGLPTPRRPAEIAGAGSGEAVVAGESRVVDNAGTDVTAEYLRGAREVLKVARLSGATQAILKARSPSCGSAGIHDGSFSGTLVDGAGVTAALLRQHGIEVRSEENLSGA